MPQQREKNHKGMNRASQACDNYDLTINAKKTEVVHQLAPGKPYITVKG